MIGMAVAVAASSFMLTRHYLCSGTMSLYALFFQVALGGASLYSSSLFYS